MGEAIINAQSPKRLTTLAPTSGSTNFVELMGLLVQSGADLEVKDQRGIRLANRIR